MILGLTVTGTPAQTGSAGEKVLIRAAKPYNALVARIESLGGRITYQYKYVDAVAAEVPRSALTSLRDLVGVGAITKDEIIALPGSVDTVRGRNLTPSTAASDVEADSVEPLSAADIQSLATVNQIGRAHV